MLSVLSIMFLSESLCIAFLLFSLSITLFIHNLSQFSDVIILPVQVKYKNLTSLLHSSTLSVYNINVLNISFIYIQNPMKQYNKFWSNHKTWFIQLKKKRNSVVFTHVFAYYVLSSKVPSCIISFLILTLIILIG